MAIKYINIGSTTGVFGYDDAVYTNSIEVDNPIKVNSSPTDPAHVLRLEDIATKVYPIGSVFLSVVSTNPGTLLGFGTWVRIAEGQFLAGFKLGDADFDPVGNTGGSKTVSHDNNHSGTDVANHADHTHSGPASHPESVDVQGVLPGNVVTSGSHGDTGGTTSTLTHSVTQPAAHSDHNILNPFFVIYVWKRTA